MAKAPKITARATPAAGPLAAPAVGTRVAERVVLVLEWIGVGLLEDAKEETGAIEVVERAMLGEVAVVVLVAVVTAVTAVVVLVLVEGEGAGLVALGAVKAAHKATAACWAWMSSAVLHLEVRQTTIRGSSLDWKSGLHWHAWSVRAQPAWGT